MKIVLGGEMLKSAEQEKRRVRELQAKKQSIKVLGMR